MRLLLCCCLIIVIAGCKEKYEPPVTSPGIGYLVIEGIISAQGPADIRLSRTIPLPDSARTTNESRALVQLEGTDGSKNVLTESGTGTGVYKHPMLNLNSNHQYRLFIKTRDGKDYASDFVKVRIAPPIDSISWIRENEGVRIYINTHDPQNNTWYYRWETEETWEFHSNYYTSLEFNIVPPLGEIKGVKYRRPDRQVDESLFKCWQNENSTKLLLGSSAKLSEDVIHLPLIYIPQPSWKLGVLYSILIKQYALTREEYEFLQKMKRNSEETGSIFDRQPSELKGNVRCLTKPEEPVIGFIGIANRYEKRIFIKRNEVPDWGYFMRCEYREIPSDSAEFYPNWAPIAPAEFSMTGAIIKYSASEWTCVDCTRRGRNVKPTFWP
jgi:hypothetical protein